MISVSSPAPENKIPFWLVIPASGIGTRVGADLPKQYCVMHGKTILEHTIDAFLDIPLLKGVVVALQSDDQYFARSPLAKNALVRTVVGGKERADSVLNALNFLADKDNKNPWVLVHDAVRPCVQTADIVAMIQDLAISTVGGIMAVPVGDTIKLVNDTGGIVKTEDRRFLWQAQTPQMFHLHILREALQMARDKKMVVTDEASAMELLGYMPGVFQGKRSNIKITLPEDLMIAEALLRQAI
jgi:2-C-methyl-D-erythritol 4-phosphate cytidylyltransferase